jgi:hypothetical protein
MKVTLWVPSSGDAPRWPCVLSWMELQKQWGTTLDFTRSLPGDIKVFWNKVVKDFLASGNDWLFSCHHDIIFLPQTLERLLSWDKPLVSALVFMRQSPVIPHVWNSYGDNHQQPYAIRVQDTFKWIMDHDAVRFGPYVLDPRPEDALTDIDFTSTSCCLIHRSVLEAMRDGVAELWFKYDNDFNGGGEDRNFFENARAAGFPAYVDRSCGVGHLVGDIPSSAADFIAWSSVSEYKGTGEPAKV